LAASAFVLGAGTMAYSIRPPPRAPASSANVETYKMLQLFGDVVDQVQRQYVTRLDEKKLIQSASTAC